MTLDTGASKTLVRPDLVKAAMRNKKVTYRLLVASGQVIHVLVEITVTMDAEIIDDCILGLDFMKNQNCRINFFNRVFKYGYQEIFILGGSTGQVTCVRRFTILAKSEAQVSVKLPSDRRNAAN
ncbi:unnamed protein product [Arctia plantaginis]|uniref:Peptidase A2 domain-containing protein n=1 Tax=Arctia plantaginis TaxID=874455 RepID=A0A8S0ZCB4_ARCPL|nr:unnamed protein product [Arctia plantaginis]